MKYKGFLHYQEGNWLLSSQAKFKTCCQQSDLILVNYPFPKGFAGKQIELEGKIKASDVFAFQLVDVSIVSQAPKFNFPWISLGLGFGIVVFIIFYRFKKARR